MYKFYLGQDVVYQPPRGTFVPSGTWVVTAKLPERNGESYHRVRHAIERHERLEREGELSAIGDDDEAPAGRDAMKREPRFVRSRVRRRTVRTGKHKTSLTVEEEFWQALREIAIVQQSGQQAFR